MSKKWIYVWNLSKPQNKNLHPQDLGLKFEKTNIEIRINIFEILCVHVCVPVFRQNKQLWLFSPNFLKSGSRVGNSENYCWKKNQRPSWYIMCANFQSKWTTLSFLAQICPKEDLGFEAEKNNVRIRINIVEMLCANFQPNWKNFLTFLVQICPTMDLGWKFRKLMLE